MILKCPVILVAKGAVALLPFGDLLASVVVLRIASAVELLAVADAVPTEVVPPVDYLMYPK